jgi:hypothetical protein
LEPTGQAPFHRQSKLHLVVENDTTHRSQPKQAQFQKQSKPSTDFGTASVELQFGLFDAVSD